MDVDRYITDEAVRVAFLVGRTGNQEDDLRVALRAVLPDILTQHEADVAYYDENTMHKVYNALQRAGLDRARTLDAITCMQNVGILFRESRMAGKATAQDNEQ